MKYTFLLFFTVFFSFLIYGQNKNGKSNKILIEIRDTSNQPVPFANVYVDSRNKNYTANAEGFVEIKVESLPADISISSVGYINQKRTINSAYTNKSKLIIFLEIDVLGLDEVVITGTRNKLTKRESPVLVSTINSKSLTRTQSNSLAEGLNFSPGVRVETNCQNCGFTQVRLNGLQGSYTQILVNSRPVFSSLLGVYGLEQIPVNSIQNIEIVRGGGSALYGSNAIAGTINVITKDPVLNAWDISTTLSSIDNKSTDLRLDFNSSIVSDDLMSGVRFYGNYRTREAYDANNDGFTELVELNSNSMGAKAYLKPNDLSRISTNINVIKEYRRGGDKLDLAPQFTDITEQVEHNTVIGGLDYELNNKAQTKHLNAYASVSHTKRDSYYGGLGGKRTTQDSIAANNAFGNTKDLAINTGLKHTTKIKDDQTFIMGAEYNLNTTEDDILGYNRVIDQDVNNYALYAQYKLILKEKFTALLGTRLDHIDVNGFYQVGQISRSIDIGQTALSPRLSLSYDINNNHKLRAGYARGFRAPQAFNEELHVSSVGGEQLFVILSEDLETEYSNAFTLSYHFNFRKNLSQYDILLESFYTSLENPFTQVSTGSVLPNNSILEEVRNGSGASVYGVNFEFSYSPNTKFLMQSGLTVQNSSYNNPQILFESENENLQTVVTNSFVRNPDVYGYLNFGYTPDENWSIDTSINYTGSMIVPRVINEDGFIDLIDSQDFLDINLRASKKISINETFSFNVFGGIKNIFNSYQDDFDVGPTRDSDYIYGPAAPRSLFIGIKVGQF